MRWFGHIYSERGMEIDPERKEVIKAWANSRQILFPCADRPALQMARGGGGDKHQL